MVDWTTFAAFAVVVLGFLLVLSHLSQQAFEPVDSERAIDPSRDTAARSEVRDAGWDGARAPETVVERPAADADREALGSQGAPDGETPTPDEAAHRRRSGDGAGLLSAEPRVFEADHARGDRAEGFDRDISTAALLANVTVSQGAFALLLLGGAWIAGVPASAFGIGSPAAWPAAVGIGAALGVGLYAANEVGAAAGDRIGLGRSETLREGLAPDTLAGWAVLLLVVLPIIAGFEELLFRGTLVGALAMGFDLSPWLLAAFSSVAFALGHGAQGPAGIVVTGLLGFVLAAAFVLTGSLLTVVVAHYLVNALEFVIHEGIGWEWTESDGAE